ncbi:hypothetical protein [Staphylococcus aureus]
MLCIPMVMHKNPSDKSIYGQRYNEDG